MNQNVVLGTVLETNRTPPPPRGGHVRTLVVNVKYTYYSVGGAVHQNAWWNQSNMVGGVDMIPAYLIKEVVSSYWVV